MDLPTFRSVASRRHARRGNTKAGGTGTENSASSEKTATPPTSPPDGPSHVRSGPSRRRKGWVMASMLLYLISTIFLILTLTSNLSPKSALSTSYLYRLNLTNILSPALSTTTPLPFLNSLARSLGLHDFYQIGLWSYCAGYDSDGITVCSHPKALYYFDPVTVLVNELLAGATIALPAQIVTIIKLIRIASHVMFGCFMTGACMNFVAIFTSALMLRGRGGWVLVTWGLIAALLTTVAAVVGTAMAVIFQKVATSQSELNIGAEVGVEMMCFMWIAAGASLGGWAVVFGGCCMARRKRRRVRREEKGEEKGGLGRRKTHGAVA